MVTLIKLFFFNNNYRLDFMFKKNLLRRSYTKEIYIYYSNMAEMDDSRKRLLLLTTKIPSDVSFAVSFL